MFLSKDISTPPRPCVLHGDSVRCEWLREQLFDFDILPLLENTASEEIHVWLKAEIDAHADAGALSSIKVTDAKMAHQLYRAGHSLYCRAPHFLEEMIVPKMLKDLQWGVATWANANSDRNVRGNRDVLFMKGHTTEWHTDFQENFTIQLTGVKKWRFRGSDMKNPLRGCTPNFLNQGRDVVETQLKAAQLCTNNVGKGEEEMDVILRPGDVLYHPAGVYHRVECLEDSVAINVSMYASSYADLVASAIQQLLSRHAGTELRPRPTRAPRCLRC